MIFFQFIMTWACLSGMAILGLHTAVQVSPEFREWLIDAIKPYMDDAMFHWGQEMSRRFGPLLFAWVYIFFLPVLIPVSTLVIKIAMTYSATHNMRKVEPLVMKEVDEKFLASMEAQRASMISDIARIAHNAVWSAGCEEPELESWTPWSRATMDQRQQSISLANKVLNDPGAEYTDWRGLFLTTVITVADVLEERGVCVWPAKVTVTATDAGSVVWSAADAQAALDKEDTRHGRDAT